MLTVNQLAKNYGVDTLFENVSFTVNAGERVGLVGPNGCGKTTLLKILTGRERASAGSVRFNPSALRVGYLEQGLSFDPADTLGGFTARITGDAPALSSKLEALAVSLAADPAQESVQEAYDETLARLEDADRAAQQAPAILSALGLDQLPPELPVAALSGGQ